jgi:hypothetical protein
MPKRVLAVIIDGGEHGDRIAEWQRRSLEQLREGDEVILLVCTNTRLRRDPLRYPLYYALNLFTVRNPLTRSAPLGNLSDKVVERIEFASEAQGAWQVLPEAVIDRISQSEAVAVIKLGMGLLRVPAGFTLPILSWHHGDPEHFRGRPAGFWELLAGWPVLGQMVQVIGDKLDAGRVVAFAETRLIRHSWRASLIEAFRHSPLLLEPALDNALRGACLPKPTTGRNYRLPSNWQVTRLVLRLARAKMSRLVSGALFEKRWRVSRADVPAAANAVGIANGSMPIGPEAEWWTPQNPSGCVFTADPFFGADKDQLLVEAMPRWTGKGQIHVIRRDGASARLSIAQGHHSYPALVESQGEILCVPETAQWSAPTAYRWQGVWKKYADLRIEGAERLTDPTFFRHEGRLYLFANDARFGSGVLRLWTASDLLSPFTEHPASPIRISPRGSRMGGNLLSEGEQIVRLGQDCSLDYGDGLIAFAVEEISPTSYREREIGIMRLPGRKGPHTFNLSPQGKAVVFDWYREAFTPMAGIRRAIARLR